MIQWSEGCSFPGRHTHHLDPLLVPSVLVIWSRSSQPRDRAGRPLHSSRPGTGHYSRRSMSATKTTADSPHRCSPFSSSKGISAGGNKMQHYHCQRRTVTTHSSLDLHVISIVWTSLLRMWMQHNNADLYMNVLLSSFNVWLFEVDIFLETPVMVPELTDELSRLSSVFTLRSHYLINTIDAPKKRPHWFHHYIIY